MTNFVNCADYFKIFINSEGFSGFCIFHIIKIDEEVQQPDCAAPHFRVQ